MNSSSGNQNSAEGHLPENTDRTGELSVDERFEILKNNRRRLVLEHLHEVGGTVQLSDLADHVTATENDTEISAITSTERKRVYVGLYQFHLPKMADMGVIDYDQDRGDVALTELGERLHREHDDGTVSGRRWHLAYLGIAAGGIVAVGVSLWFDSAPLAAALLALQTVVLGCVALAQTYTASRSAE